MRLFLLGSGQLCARPEINRRRNRPLWDGEPEAPSPVPNIDPKTPVRADEVTPPEPPQPQSDPSATPQSTAAPPTTSGCPPYRAPQSGSRSPAMTCHLPDWSPALAVRMTPKAFLTTNRVLWGCPKTLLFYPEPCWALRPGPQPLHAALAWLCPTPLRSGRSVAAVARPSAAQEPPQARRPHSLQKDHSGPRPPVHFPAPTQTGMRSLHIRPHSQPKLYTKQSVSWRELTLPYPPPKALKCRLPPPRGVTTYRV